MFCVRTQVNLNKSTNEVCHSFTQSRHVIIEGIHVHPSVNLLRGLRGALQSLSTARTPRARPSLCPRKIPTGTRGAPYPPHSLLAGSRSVLAGVWNYLWPVLYVHVFLDRLTIYLSCEVLLLKIEQIFQLQNIWSSAFNLSRYSFQFHLIGQKIKIIGFNLLSMLVLYD